MEKPELADVLLGLRQELYQEQERARGETIAFKVEDVELELQLAVVEDKSAKFGAKYFVDMGVSGSEKKTYSHKLKLRFKLENEQGGPIKLSDRG